MLLKVCLTFEKPTTLIAKAIIIINGGIKQTICDSMEMLENLASCMFPMAFIPYYLARS